MKKILCWLVMICWTSPIFAAEMGIVVVGERGCDRRDRIVINTNSGYVFAEVYTGYFSKGDEVVGNLNAYGMKDVLVNGSRATIWIDDYWLSKTKAAEKCFRK